MTARPLLFLPLLMVAGCSSTATRFWTVEPVAATAPPAATAAAPIQIAAVHVPLAIDRLEIVRHDEAGRIKVLDFDRWSAPPGDLLRRALTQDLVAQLPPGGVVFPDAPAPAATRRIVVDVLDVRRSGDGYAMQLSWAVTTPNGRPHQLRLEATGAGAAAASPKQAEVAAQADALGSMMAQLAADIAAALASGRA